MVNETPKISPTGRYQECEAIKLLGISRKTFQRARDANELRKIPDTGRKVYYRGKDLLSYYFRH